MEVAIMAIIEEFKLEENAQDLPGDAGEWKLDAEFLEKQQNQQIFNTWLVMLFFVCLALLILILTGLL
jgi:hypothetical protein